MNTRTFIPLIFLLTGCASAGNEYLTPVCVGSFSNEYIGLVQTVDLDKDGVLDILAGSSISGMVYDYVYKGADCTSDWSPQWAYNTQGDVKSLYVADIDKDGRNELLVNGVASSGIQKRAKANLFVLQHNGVAEWEEDKVGGFTNSVYAADIDDDGLPEIIMGSENKKIYVLDGKNTLKWEYATDYPVHFVYSADLEGDGTPEVIAMSQTFGTAKIYVLDGNGKPKWDYPVEGGIYIAASRENVKVADLDADGTHEIVVGTYKHGVDVLDEKGDLEWNYPLDRLVSTLHITGMDKNGEKELIVGARPYVYALSSNGNLRWKSPVNTTVYSIFAADIDSDGSPNVLIGATSYINVLDHEGGLMGSWSYKEEIKGMDKLYSVKDANARAVSVADLDNDNEPEIVVGFGWTEDRLDQNYYLGSIKLFEVNKEYMLQRETTTVEKAEATTSLATTVSVQPQDKPEEGGGLMCLSAFLPIILLGLSLLLGVLVR